MGLVILNPDLQAVIAAHREEKNAQVPQTVAKATFGGQGCAARRRANALGASREKTGIHAKGHTGP